MRVVSLLPSATEIACALGHREVLVGRSHECDHPAGIEALPVVCQPAIRVGGTSDEVDRAVMERLERALSIYRIDGDLLSELAPDVVLTQTQCEVCAVSPADVARALGERVDRDVEIVALEPNRLADVWDDIRRVANALGDVVAGERLIARLETRMAAIGERASFGATLVTIEWIDPLMTAGNWMPELVAIAGGRQLLGTAGEHSPFIDWSAVVAADPDVLLVSPCGYSIDRTLAEMPALAALPGWLGLRAVRSGRVFIADGNAYFHRPGPRLVESAEILAAILDPTPAGSGPGYVRYS